VGSSAGGGFGGTGGDAAAGGVGAGLWDVELHRALDRANRGTGGAAFVLTGAMNFLETSSPRPSPPQVCGGEGEDARRFKLAGEGLK